MTMKIKPEDKWFSRCVRERANWICECCGKAYEENSQGLHCSHFFSRRHKATRWSPINAAAHCFSCHQRLGGNPIEFADWIATYLDKHYGPLAYPTLIEQKNSIIKITKKDMQEIAIHYQGQYHWLKKLRAEGDNGRIEFEGW